MRDLFSNHVRATAAAAQMGGLDMFACYWGNPPDQPQGNFKLVKLLGAEARFSEDMDRNSVDRLLEKVAEELRDQGRSPYVIPRGGACPLGVVGHVLAVAEFARQCESGRDLARLGGARRRLRRDDGRLAAGQQSDRRALENRGRNGEPSGRGSPQPGVGFLS